MKKTKKANKRLKLTVKTLKQVSGGKGLADRTTFLPTLQIQTLPILDPIQIYQ